MALHFEGQDSQYYEMQGADRIDGPWQGIRMVLGATGDQQVGGDTAEPVRFFRLVERPRAQSGDEDQDGLDDVYELGFLFLDPLVGEDAGQDWDFDGWSNLFEYQQQSDPATRDPTGVSATLYVDATAGQDSHDGLARLPENGHGPKKTLPAALAESYDLDTIELAAGNYITSPSDLLSRSVTLRPQGTVVLQSP